MPADEVFLRALYASTRAREMAITGWDPAQQEEFLRWQFDLQRTHYRAHYAGASFDVILLDDRPAGRIYVHRAARETRLMDIALVPEVRGRGIGSGLIRALIEDAASRGAIVTLNVEPYNPAYRLYERLGFRSVEADAANVFMAWKANS
jgi:ribosomal protein S18 acetylase RimI-like enzyme